MELRFASEPVNYGDHDVRGPHLVGDESVGQLPFPAAGRGWLGRRRGSCTASRTCCTAAGVRRAAIAARAGVWVCGRACRAVFVLGGLRAVQTPACLLCTTARLSGRDLRSDRLAHTAAGGGDGCSEAVVHRPPAAAGPAAVVLPGQPAGQERCLRSCNRTLTEEETGVGVAAARAAVRGARRRARWRWWIERPPALPATRSVQALFTRRLVQVRPAPRWKLNWSVFDSTRALSLLMC